MIQIFQWVKRLWFSPDPGGRITFETAFAGWTGEALEWSRERVEAGFDGYGDPLPTSLIESARVLSTQWSYGPPPPICPRLLAETHGAGCLATTS